MADQMPWAEIGTQPALLADGASHGKHRAFVLHSPLNKRMAFRQHQQAAGGFGHRVIERGDQAAHHRTAVNKTGVIDRRAARQRQYFAQRHADGDRDGQRSGDRAVNGQRAAGHRKLLLNRTGNIEDRLHVIDHHADAVFRLEVYDFSEAVFQEALLNALAHRSYEDMAPVYVKHYPTKIVIENPGGFPGDINESNIITHQSIPRNKLIAMTLQHLKYVQRSGQGVDIMFQSMLTEGKPYPEYASTPNSVRLTLRSTMENQSFVRFIAETQDKRSKMFTLSELMILHYLREHQKITLKQAAKTIQETDDNAHKVLNSLRDEGLLELNGKTYMLSLKVYETVKTDVAYVQDKTVSQIQAKDRILEYLKHKPWITNQKAQELCGFNKNQTYYILHQMCKDGILQPDGVGRGTKYKSVK